MKMIKQLLFGAAFAVTALMNAQTGKIVKQTIVLDMPNNTTEQGAITQGALPPTCYTLTTLTGTALSVGTAGSDTSVPGCSPVAGYVYGSNCYDDKEKANFFASGFYSGVTQPSVSQVVVYFYGTATKGTIGTASVPVNVSLYAGTSATVAPTGAALGTSTANLGQVVAAHTNTASNIWTYTYNFVPSITIPTTGFYTSLVIPTTAGDTAVVANQTTAVNTAWEKWSDDTWNSIILTWGTNGNLAMMPVVCGNSVTTGISANSGLSKNVSLMPNPSTGIVNISVNSPSKENLNISVTNALGQIVNSASYEVISSNNLTLDLTNQANGVYFVTISNGNDKMVQRLILNK